jgi:hypothetical protein
LNTRLIDGRASKFQRIKRFETTATDATTRPKKITGFARRAGTGEA